MLTAFTKKRYTSAKSFHTSLTLIRSNSQILVIIFDNLNSFCLQIAALQADFTRKLADSSSNRTEVRELKTRMEVLTRRLREKEDEAKMNDDRIRDLEVQLANEKDRLAAVLAEKNDAIEALEKQVSELMKQLQDIMEENVRLDMEIATYRNLLEGEESR